MQRGDVDVGAARFGERVRPRGTDAGHPFTQRRGRQPDQRHGRPREPARERVEALGGAGLRQMRRAALAQEYAFVGIPPSVTFRIAWWPCHAVRFRVEAVFQQTPGPGAGAPLGADGGPR